VSIYYHSKYRFRTLGIMSLDKVSKALRAILYHVSR
jgi:hypothetical protein